MPIYPPKVPEIVKYTVWLHGDDDSMYERAMIEGFSNTEIERYGLSYIGYEVRGDVEVNRTTGEVTVTWSD
jgi:hypothetical protein